jgi:nucleoside 2-deoxyribosyltransferase
MASRIYLAGPEVFLPDALEIAEQKKAICRRHGLEGVFPVDTELADLRDVRPAEIAHRIGAGNVALMTSCDGVIANLTPFRGVSADAGTVFEIGYMSSLNRIVLGYSNVAAPYKERAIQYYAVPAAAAADPYSAGTSIEDFGFVDNLMIECAVRACGGEIVVSRVPPGMELRALHGFERCVAQTKLLLSDRAALSRMPRRSSAKR